MTGTTTRRLIAGLALSAALGTAPALALPGDLDPTFGAGDAWVVTTEFQGGDDVIRAIVLQPDGRLVAAGFAHIGGDPEFALVRYNDDGTLDTAFGGGTGMVTTPVGGSVEQASALVLQPDGKLVAAGYAFIGGNAEFALVRYNSDGSLDTSFGGGTGKVTTPVGTGDFAAALVLQPDGKLVAAGVAMIGGAQDFALVRYNSDGSLDTSFGGGTGKVTTPVGTGHDYAFALVLQPDGKLVAAGNVTSGVTENLALVRYNSDGSLDTSFGGGTGKVTTPVGSDGRITEMVLQPDGKLVAAAWAEIGANRDFALVRYNSDGSLDTSFGGGTGKVTTPVGTGDDFADALVLQPDGKLVAAGISDTGGSSSFALVRYNSDGSLDTSFGAGTGKVTTPVGSDSRAYGMMLQPDGRLVAAGYADVGSPNFDFALVRYNPDGSTDTGLTPGIVSVPGLYTSGVIQTADGKLVVAGSTEDAKAMLTRYLPDGTRDTSLGLGIGVVTTSFGGSYQYFADVLEQPDGKLVAGGCKGTGTGCDFVLARYFANGVLDGSFGPGGGVATDFAGDDDAVLELLRQPDGKLLAVGYAGGSSYDFGLARYTATGALDATFGSGGTVTTDFGGGDFAESALLYPDGRIVAAGHGGGDILVARYTDTGLPDPTFGGGTGKVTLAAMTDHDSTDVVLLPDNTLLLSATGYDGGGTPYQLLLRLNDDGTLDAGFGSGGVVIGPVGNCRTVVRAANGTILVAGDTDPFFDPSVPGLSFKVTRFRADGTLDPTFGSGGVAIVPIAGEVYGDLLLQPDGKAVLAGDNYAQDGHALVRLQTIICHDPDPTATCATAAKTQLQWKQGADPGKHKLAFKWGNGDQTLPGDLADPLADAAYSLCVADADGIALLASAPPGGTCDGKPCWKASATGYGFKDKSAANDGLVTIKMKAGAAGKAKALAKGKGANLPDGDGQPLAGTVHAVLVNEQTGFCAAAAFSGAEISLNDGVTFKAKAP